MVKRFFKNGVNFFFKQQTTILSGAVVIGFLSFLSALLGLVKVRLYAGLLGAGLAYDTFVAAFKLPDFMFQLIVAGSINAAFIPIFSEYIAKKNSETAWRFASQILSLALVLFALLSLAVFILARPLSVLVAAGFTPGQVDNLVHLMRIMLLAPIFLGISAFISGCLQSFQRFWLPFLAPVLYNLGAIFGVLFLYQPLGLSGLAWGVVLGSLFHLAVQLPLLRSLGFRYRPSLNWRSGEIRRLVRLSLPRTLGLAADQIKSLIIVSLASLLRVGSISLLRFGESIQVLPVMVFGVAISQASLPILSAQTGAHRRQEFNRTLLSSLNQIFYLTLPVSVILIVLKIPVVRLVLGVGRFDWSATIGTSWILALLSLSLVAQAGHSLLLRAFYARQETKAPALVSLLAAILSIAAGLVLMPFYQVNALAFGITVGATFEFLVLLIILYQRTHFDLKSLLTSFGKMFFSAILMAAAIYVPVRVLDQVFIDTRRVINLVILVWLVLSFGGVVYLLSTFLLGCEEIRIFLRVLVRMRNLRETFLSARWSRPFETSKLDEG